MAESADTGLLVVCETAELAVACLQAADASGVVIGTRVEPSFATALRELDPRVARGIALLTPPSLTQLTEIAALTPTQQPPPVLAVVGSGPDHARVFDAAGDLGLPVVNELAPMLAALGLLARGARAPYAVGTRRLSSLDRVRIGPLLGSVGGVGGELVSEQDGRVAFEPSDGGDGSPLGTAPEVGRALRALQGIEAAPQQVTTSVDDVDEGAVSEILFGPRRALSDPASKAALAPYGIPMPIEELCASASRAAAEASRIGYPVRIALASPDLRVWDNPELAVDMVDNAARVRDTYRQLMAMASSHIANASASAAASREIRLLGVSVSATNQATALLGVVATPLPDGHVATQLHFCDPHGWASQDRTTLILPAPVSRIERAIDRLDGSALIRQGTAAQRRQRVDNIADVLLRVAAFVKDRGAEVESVELRPLALRVDGGVEVREACVAVSDSFERSLG